MLNMPIDKAQKAEHLHSMTPLLVKMPLVGCEYGLCAWAHAYPKQAQSHLCGSGLLFQDGQLRFLAIFGNPYGTWLA